MSKIVKVVFLSLIVTILSACGGSLEIIDDSTTYPFRNAYIASLFTSSQHNFFVSGNVNAAPVDGSGSLIEVALVDGVFLGRDSQQQTSIVTGSFTLNGVRYSLDKTEISYYDANFNLLGQTGSEFLIVTGTTYLPSTVQPGDRGTLYSGRTYIDGTFTTQKGTKKAVFFVENNTFERSLLTIEITDYDLSGRAVSTTTNLFYLTVDGRLLPINSTFESGNELIISNFV